MAKNPIQFSHPYPATTRLFQQARLARLARASLASEAAQLSPTEGELLNAGIGSHVIPLNKDWPNLLGDLFSLGDVRMVTAGVCAFIEKHGIYRLPEFSETQITFFDNDMEIAIHLSGWGHAFAVFPTADSNTGLTEYSLHFFDRDGTAMHRIFLSPAGSIEAFERIADEYRHYAAVRPRSSGLQPSASPQLPEVTSRAGLALKHGAGGFVRKVQSYELLRGLHNCQQTKLLVRISIGTVGCMQTHTGVLRGIQGGPFWTCAIGEDTFLYFRDADIEETHIVEAWIGDMRSMSLCAFDAHGRLVATLGVEEIDSRLWNHWLESLSDI